MASPDLRADLTPEPSGSAIAEAAAQPPEQAAPSASPVLVADTAEAPASFEPDDAVQLDASKLHCYQVALELHTQCSTLVALLNRIVKDQLERASLSVVLNIAEAGGRRSRRDKARFYAIARGSATEVAALLDVLAMRRLASPTAIKTGRRLAIRCVQMLTRIHQRLA
jgi:four helix bundle protein